MTTTWSPTSRCGAKVGLCLPRSTWATRVASRPRTLPSASTRNHLRSIAPSFGITVAMFRTLLWLAKSTTWRSLSYKLATGNYKRDPTRSQHSDALGLPRRGGLPRPGAEISHRAGGAGRLAGEAGATPVNDEEMGRLGPARLGQERGEIIVNLLGIFRPGEPEPLAHACHVRVHGDGGDAEGVAEHDVGRLAPHAGKRDELLEGAGHSAAVALHQRLTHAHEGSGLGLEEAGGVDLLLEDRGTSPRVVFRSSVSREERPGDRVDALVRALRRQDGGGEELEGRGELELDPRFRIRLGEAPQDLDGPRLLCCRGLSHVRLWRGRSGSARCTAPPRLQGASSARGSRARRASAARDRQLDAARGASGCAAPGCRGAHSSSSRAGRRKPVLGPLGSRPRSGRRA